LLFLAYDFDFIDYRTFWLYLMTQFRDSRITDLMVK